MSRLPNTTAAPKPVTLAGRTFKIEEVELIQQIVARYPKLSRAELGATVCELLEWERPNGRLKTRECRDLLELLEQRNLLTLPDKGIGRPLGSRTRSPARPAEQPEVISGPLKTLQPIRLAIADTQERRVQWRALIDHYHYLGFRTPFGASLRYLIQSEKTGQMLGALQYSSPAWRMQARDEWIGWDDAARKQTLQQVVSQSRFLVLPWVQVKNLASHALALSARQLADDWERMYRVRPLLIESLVDERTFSGTCYRAANWIDVGMTSGRGLEIKNRKREHKEPKRIFLYPLEKQARRKLANPAANGEAAR